MRSREIRFLFWGYGFLRSAFRLGRNDRRGQGADFSVRLRLCEGLVEMTGGLREGTNR